MQRFLQSNTISPDLSFANVRQYVEKYWFRLILIGLGLYVLMVKDINLQLSMNSTETKQESILPDDFWDSDAAASNSEFSVVPSVFSGGADGAKPQTIAKKANKQANNFSNLTFILSPTYAKRKNIPAEVVADKKRKCSNYVKRFAPVAIAEMKKFGIPASITLAQALLESNVGDSRLTRANKNHFGIKCFSKKCRKGHCSNFTDDTHKDFFRVYQSAWESYRAHSAFLQGQRYAHLQQLGATNYKGWAHGLRKAGYATDKRYAEKLIQIIEILKLHQYDA